MIVVVRSQQQTNDDTQWWYSTVPSASNRLLTVTDCTWVDIRGTPVTPSHDLWVVTGKAFWTTNSLPQTMQITIYVQNRTVQQISKVDGGTTIATDQTLMDCTTYAMPVGFVGITMTQKRIWQCGSQRWASVKDTYLIFLARKDCSEFYGTYGKSKKCSITHLDELIILISVIGHWIVTSMHIVYTLNKLYPVTWSLFTSGVNASCL